MKKSMLLGVLLTLAILSACMNTADHAAKDSFSDATRIVSLNGTLSEILVEIGFGKNIVGVDVTSTYPERLQSLPKVGHNQNLSAEGIIALQPDVIIGLAKDMKPELVEQLEHSGLKLLLFEQDYSVQGTKKLIESLADSLQRSEAALALLQQLDADLAKAQETIHPSDTPKVLFIYARGTGTMMVAGEGTPVERVIQLAGGENAVKGFPDFKPLTAESLVKANPDIILLFDSGLESLGGKEGLSAVQGIEQTNAGKNKHFIAMEGLLLTGFGPRLGTAIAELADKIHIED